MTRGMDPRSMRNGSVYSGLCLPAVTLAPPLANCRLFVPYGVAFRGQVRTPYLTMRHLIKFRHGIAFINNSHRLLPFLSLCEISQLTKGSSDPLRNIEGHKDKYEEQNASQLSEPLSGVTCVLSSSGYHWSLEDHDPSQ